MERNVPTPPENVKDAAGGVEGGGGRRQKEWHLPTNHTKHDPCSFLLFSRTAPTPPLPHSDIYFMQCNVKEEITSASQLRSPVLPSQGALFMEQFCLLFGLCSPSSRVCVANNYSGRCGVTHWRFPTANESGMEAKNYTHLTTPASLDVDCSRCYMIGSIGSSVYFNVKRKQNIGRGIDQDHNSGRRDAPMIFSQNFPPPVILEDNAKCLYWDCILFPQLG